MLSSASKQLLCLISRSLAAESLCQQHLVRQLAAPASPASARSNRKGLGLSKQLQALKRGQLPVSIDAPTESQAAAPEATEESRSWVPNWLNFLKPGSKKKEQEAKGAKEGAMDWNDLQKVATNFEVDVYRQLCYNARTSQPPPKPRVYKKPLNSRIQGQYNLDMVRVSYLRTAQHERIASNMTPGQKAAVKDDSNAVLANREMLQDIATTTGFSVPEVADCLQMYNRMRARVQYLYRWKRMGRKMPNTRDEIDNVVKELQAQEERELMQKMLAARDRENCPLRGKVQQLGRHLLCPKTMVPYHSCCGHKH